VAAAKNWDLTYGKSEAQFHQEQVAQKGTPYLGKRVTIKGVVTKIDVSDPEAAWLHLENGVSCFMGHYQGLSEHNKVGQTIYVDGFLERCEDGDVLLKPAVIRDPSAPFTPK
jgi:hypothetical protein